MCCQHPLQLRIIGAKVNIISPVIICLLNLLIHAFYEYYIHMLFQCLSSFCNACIVVKT
jgi:hypothetical protein